MSTFTRDASAGLSLRVNFAWILAGNVVYATTQWGMLVVLAKLGSPEMVGRFALGLAIASPVMGFACLRLRIVQATDARREYLFEDYLRLQLIAGALAFLVVGSIAFAGQRRGETLLVILALGTAKAVEGISDVFFGVLQQHDRMDRIGKSMMIKGSASLAALAVLVRLTGSVFWGCMGLLTSWTLVLLLYDVPGRRLVERTMSPLPSPSPDGHSVASHPRPEWRKLAALTWLTLPLGFSTMLMALETSIPRYFVSQHLGEAQLGIFAALAYFHRAGTTMINALGDAASPQLASRYAAGKGALFRSLLLRMVAFAVLLGVAGVLVARFFGVQILTLFYDSRYALRGVFVALMAASGLSYVASFLLSGLTAARHLQLVALIEVLTTGTVALACSVLVPARGLEGAALALVIARGVQAIGAVGAISLALSPGRRRVVP